MHHAQRDTTNDKYLPAAAPKPTEVPDKILNITFNFAHGSAVNNMKFVYPAVPLYHAEDLWEIIECPKTENVPLEGTTCTQIITAEVGELVELRIVVTEVNSGQPWTYHTIHIHGNDAVFYRTDLLLYHKIGNMVIFWLGNLYNVFTL